MSKATITLAPGQAGFYDELSGVYLNMEKKQTQILEGTNVSGLLRGVSDGKILVVAGSLDPVTNYIKAKEDLPNYYRLIRNKRINPNNSNTVASEAKTYEINKAEIKAELKQEIKTEIKAELSEEAKVEATKTSNKKGGRKKSTKTEKADKVKEGE